MLISFGNSYDYPDYYYQGKVWNLSIYTNSKLSQQQINTLYDIETESINCPKHCPDCQTKKGGYICTQCPEGLILSETKDCVCQEGYSFSENKCIKSTFFIIFCKFSLIFRLFQVMIWFYTTILKIIYLISVMLKTQKK